MQDPRLHISALTLLLLCACGITKSRVKGDAAPAGGRTGLAAGKPVPGSSAPGAEEGTAGMGLRGSEGRSGGGGKAPGPECAYGKWSTADDFSVSATATERYGFAHDMAEDSEGHLYAVGFVDFPFSRWIVRKSVDQGRSWKTVDSWQAHALGFGSRAQKIVIDRDDGIYVAGTASRSNTVLPASINKVVRYSGDGGRSWQSIGSFTEFEIFDLAVDAEGAVYLAGAAHDGQAVVKRSADRGRAWVTVMETGLGGGAPVIARRLLVDDRQGAVHVVLAQEPRADDLLALPRWYLNSSRDGRSWTLTELGTMRLAAAAQDPSGRLWLVAERERGWVVRRSDDGGVNFAPAGEFQVAEGEVSDYFGFSGRQLVFDGGQRPVFAGNHRYSVRGEMGASPRIRAGRDGGAWEILERFGLKANESSEASAVFVDSNDNLFYLGYRLVRDGADPMYWHIRRLSCR